MPCHLWFSSCGSKSQISKFYARHPTISRCRRWFFSFQVLCDILINAPYHNLHSIRPTCRHGEENHSWQWQCVAHNESDPPQYQAPLIHTHTIFKCFIAFPNTIRSCDMPTYILYTIHLFSNAWSLIICLCEHRTFAFRLVLTAHWCVMN